MLSLVSAERSIDVVAEAAALGCGGVVVAAGGFAELGDDGPRAAGAARRRRGAATSPIVGPNCSGFMNVPLGANLFTGGRIALHAGGVAVVSQSGFLLRSALAAGQQRQLGFGIAVSSGNEAVCELHDYVDVLAADPDTRVICLVIEKIRSAERVLRRGAPRATPRARRSSRSSSGAPSASRDIMRSHTGAIADESWVYDLVLARARRGRPRATSTSCSTRRSCSRSCRPSDGGPVRGVAVMASSGGVAGVAADAADDEGIALPHLEAIEAVGARARAG